ncbi:MAG: glyoxylate/hydroxypyruvate reductase A [Betaproteobacteria bacterium]|nr:glyoxylate/hydroxypyruvate reductase A [Betaproteobacteria bacterium]
MKILFASQVEPAERWLPLLRSSLPGDEFLLEAKSAIDVALIASPPPGTLERLKGAKLVQSLWMGVEKLLADPAYPRGVPLARLVDPGMVAAMTETVLYHVLDWHRRFYRYRENQAQGRWHRFRQYLASDHTVGILGLGELGTEAARKLRALGFNVAGWSRRPKSIEGVFSSTSIAEVLQRSDVVVCLLPLTDQTRGVLDKDRLALIKKGGGVINLARGPHVVVPDLLSALDSGHLAHAYLDVFDEEPLPAASPLWRHPGVTLTPHAAALTEPRTAVAKVVENIERVRRGEPALNLVDFAAGY